MELKTARLTLLIDPAKKEAFERLCARQDRTALARFAARGSSGRKFQRLVT